MTIYFTFASSPKMHLVSPRLGFIFTNCKFE